MARRHLPALGAAVLVVLAAACSSTAGTGTTKGGPGVYRWGRYLSMNGAWSDSKTDPTPVAGLSPVVSLAAANSATYALLADGQEWAWGNNAYGQLGDGSHTNSADPVRVRFPAGTVIKAIGEANDTGFAVDARGEGWSWGWNGRGTLCQGDYRNRDLPAEVPGLFGLRSVAGGGGSVTWLTVAGDVYRCGKEFPRGPSSNVAEAVTGLPAGDPVMAISAGNAYSSALLADGEVWDWGLGTRGQLGDGQLKSSAAPVPVATAPGTRVVQVYAGGDAGANGHQLALTSGGTVLGWGANTCGQLAKDNPEGVARPTVVSLPPGTRPTAVASGGSTSYVVDAEGNLWAWGDNSSSQVSGPATKCVATPRKVDSGVALVSSTAANVADYHAP